MDFKAKLKALHLPKSYEGLHVLDVGCGDGSFCRDAVQRDAKSVTGIDVCAHGGG